MYLTQPERVVGSLQKSPGRPKRTVMDSRNLRWLTTAILLVCCPLRSQAPPSHPVGLNAEQRQARMWQAIKEALAGPNGAEYFRLNLDSTEIPGGTDGLTRLRGAVLSSQPAIEPRVVFLAMNDKTAAPEAKLQLKRPWDHPLPEGTEVEFSGIPRSFKLDPFILTIEVIGFEVLPRPRQQSKPK